MQIPAPYAIYTEPKEDEEIAFDNIPNLMHLRHVGQLKEKSLDLVNSRIRS